MLDYRIKTFLTLYTEMNYRRTAQILHMTQPGVTMHIHFLENYYGVKLFSYDGRVLKRTKDAEILKRHVDSMALEEKEIFKDFSKQKKTVLRIGATKTIGEFVLTPYVCKFLSDSQNSINLVVDNTENLLKMLDSAKLDFAVVEGIFDKAKYPYRLFKKEHFMGICGENHKFAGKTVNIEDIFSQTLVIRESGSGTRLLLENAISECGFTLDSFKRVISVSNFSLITDIVENDGAITFAYEPVSHSKKGLATFSVSDTHIKGEFNFVFCNEKIAEEKIKLFLGE